MAEEAKAGKMANLRADTFKELLDLIRWAQERRRGWLALTPSDVAGWHIQISIVEGERVEGNRIVKEDGGVH